MEKTAPDYPIEAELNRLRKSCAKLQWVAFLGVLLLTLLIAVDVFILVASFFSLDIASSIANDNLAIPILLYFAIAIALWGLGGILRDVAHGDSPFSKRHVRPIRLSIVMLGLAIVLEAVWSPIANAITNFMIGVGVWVSTPFVSSADVGGVNIGILTAAVVLLFFERVISYGALLQQLSDETL